MKKILILDIIRAKGDSLKGACAYKSTKFNLAMLRISIIELEGKCAYSRVIEYKESELWRVFPEKLIKSLHIYIDTIEISTPLKKQQQGLPSSSAPFNNFHWKCCFVNFINYVTLTLNKKLKSNFWDILRQTNKSTDRSNYLTLFR